MATFDRRGATVSAADPPIGTNPNPDLAIKAPVRAATAGSNITLSGLQTIDGVVLAAGDRVLVKDQTDATTNGLYNVATGPWTRTIDANNNSHFAQGLMVAVGNGTANANGLFRLTALNPITLGTSALTWSLTTPPLGVGSLTVTPTAGSLTPGVSITQSAAGTSAVSLNFNSILISPDTVNAGANFVQGLSIIHGFGTSPCQGGRQALDVTLSLNAATNASNPNRNYVAGILVAQAQSSDGGGVGTEKGSLFALNPVVLLTGAATNFVQAQAMEANTQLQTGSSALDKYGIKVVQTATDAVAGSRNDAAFLLANQSGAVGWGTLIQIGDAINASPLKTTGSLLAIKGAPTIANGIDLSGAGAITGSAFKSPNFNVLGTGVTQIGSATSGFLFSSSRSDSTNALFAGTTKGVRIVNGASISTIEGVDATGTGSFQPLGLNGSSLAFQISGSQVGQFAASGGFSVGTASDPGAGAIYVNNASFLIRTKTSFTNGAGASTATLTNAPAAGNPTKWIAIDDNGTTRQIPAW